MQEANQKTRDIAQGGVNLARDLLCDHFDLSDHERKMIVSAYGRLAVNAGHEYPDLFEVNASIRLLHSVQGGYFRNKVRYSFSEP